MKKGWTMTKLIAIGAMAVVRFLIKIIFYTTLLATTGSIFSGITILIIGPFFRILTALIIGQFGAVMAFSVLSFFIELPLPGIFPPVVNLVYFIIVGFVVDSAHSILRSRKKLFSLVGGFASNLIDVLFVIFLYFTIGLFGSEGIPQFMTTPLGIVISTLVVSALGLIPGILAYLTYEKLKNTAIIKRIQK